LKPRQAGLVDELLPHLAIALNPPPLDEDEAAPAAYLDLAALDGEGVYKRLIFEIGFGGGEHLVAQAAANPDTLFLGAEPFLNGVGSCLRHIEEAGVTNVRLHHGDARDVLAALADASLDRVDILFPDPWPKTRHHKRRLIQPEFLNELARVAKPGAEVRFATDWAHYAACALEVFTRDQRFTWSAERAEDWRSPWPGHTPTRYETKKLGDCAPIWLRFARR
jgi:tRNA (guanine-N7-)-methyltransferase